MQVDVTFATPDLAEKLGPMLGHVPGAPLRVSPFHGVTRDLIAEGSLVVQPAASAPESSAPAALAPAKSAKSTAQE